MLSDCCRLGKPTFVGAHGKGRYAPTPDLPALAAEWRGPLRVLGCLPLKNDAACTDGRRSRTLEGGNRGPHVGARPAAYLWGIPGTRWLWQTITSLRSLFEPHAFETVLRRYLNEDEEQTPRPTAHNLANTLIGLADRFFGSDPEGRELIMELRRLRKCLGPKLTGLTKKNRRLLLELSEPAVRARLYELPERLATWAARATPIRGALAMQFGLAIAILLIAPIRIANLAALRFDRHLLRPSGPRSLWLIDIPEDEVKNRVRLVHELPKRVTALLDRFRRDFRPHLAPPGNPYLFPRGPRHTSPMRLSQAISRTIDEGVGIYMTPHQFRHLAGLLMPTDLEALAQLLGHKNASTVRNYYVELNTLHVGRRFDAIIETELHKLGHLRRKD